LKSGETPSAMLAALRRLLWEPECLKSAKANIQAAMYRKASYTTKDGFDKQKTIETQMSEKMEKMTMEYYPDCWLSFILLSLPADAKCIAAFYTKSGKDTLQEHYNSTFDSKEQLSRRQKKAVNASSSVVDVTGNKRSDSPLETPESGNIIVHKISRMGDSAFEMQRRGYMQMIELYESMNGSNEHDDEIKTLKTKLIDLLKSNMATHGGSNLSL